MKQAPPAKQQLTTVVALFLMLHAWTTFSQAQAGDLYWTEALLVPQLQTSDADGNNVTPIVTSGLGTPLHTDVDPTGGKIYWAEIGGIRRADLNGGNIESIFSTASSSPYGIAVDSSAGKLYWSMPSENKIQRSNLDGTVVEDIVTGTASQPVALAVDPIGAKLYWSEDNTGGTAVIRRSNLNGTVNEQIQLLDSSVVAANGLALDQTNQRLYWGQSAANDTGQVWRSNLDGTGATNIISSGLNDIEEIAVDVTGGKVYFTQPDLSTIQRSNLNGSSIETVLNVGSNAPFGLAFLTTSGTGCDFTGDTNCDLADINLLFDQGDLVGGVAVGAGNQFDMNSDMTLNGLDIDSWLSQAATHNSFGTPYRRGDTELNRKVDITDFNSLSTNFAPGGIVPSPGFIDGNFDGDDDVDITDFNSLSTSFSPSGYAGQGISIPEPGTFTLWSLASLLLWSLSRRTRA
ncbi:MAG: hypothetical protein MK179_08330 [Pirellulaceae bacterium]|nr:hypothetical protein [Pirellulaceae bacterium]